MLNVAVCLPLTLIRLPVRRDHEYVNGGIPPVVVALLVPAAVPSNTPELIFSGLGESDTPGPPGGGGGLVGIVLCTVVRMSRPKIQLVVSGAA